MAGQVIMQGFVRFAIPVWLRRLLTMAPAFGAVLLGVDTTRALVWSQVVLSMALPMPMIAMLVLMRRPAVMGAHRMRGPAQVAAGLACALVLGLNAVLVAGL